MNIHNPQHLQQIAAAIAQDPTALAMMARALAPLQPPPAVSPLDPQAITALAQALAAEVAPAVREALGVPELINQAEAARRLGVSPATVTRMVRAGELPRAKCGKIRVEDVTRMLEGR